MKPFWLANPEAHLLCGAPAKSPVPDPPPQATYIGLTAQGEKS